MEISNHGLFVFREARRTNNSRAVTSPLTRRGRNPNTATLPGKTTVRLMRLRKAALMVRQRRAEVQTSRRSTLSLLREKDGR